MRIGLHSAVWGPRIEDLEHALDVIAAAGYQGVEFAQRPEDLGDVEHLLRLLGQRRLALIGLDRGCFQERMDFCGDFRPEFLYVENWDAEVAPRAVANGFVLALHPHFFKAIRRLSDALKCLDEHRELKFLPDTAHLTIAGDDPVEAIKVGRDRLAGIHLKDWAPEYGRSCHRYARGFVELGRGTIDLDEVIEQLRATDYQGWVVVEVNNPTRDPAASAMECAEWLAQRSLLHGRPRAVKRPCRAALPADRTCAPEAEIRFNRRIMQAGAEGLESFYHSVALAFAELIPCDLATVWTCSQAQELISLLAIWPEPPVRLATQVLKWSEALSGEAVATQKIMRFDLTHIDTAKGFGLPALLEAMNLEYMVSIPVLNSYNPNHVRFLVVVCPRSASLPLSDNDLARFASDIGIAADSALDDCCSRAAAQTNVLAGRSACADGFLDVLTEHIRSLFACQGVSVFLVDDSGERLILATSTGLQWTVREDSRFYCKGEGLTGKVWSRNETLVTPNAPKEDGWVGKSLEKVSSPGTHVCLAAPLVKTSGEVIGVVRCRNKGRGTAFPPSTMFSDDDAAVLDAVAAEAAPHLEVFLSQERRAKALQKLIHELKVPLVAIRGAAEFMLNAEGVKDFFDYDYPGDIWSWSELMRGLLGSAESLPFTSDRMRGQARVTLLMKEVIAPAVRQVELLLRARKVSGKSISYGGFEEFPPLLIDRNQFQQVIFNLLSNAITHGYRDPRSFRIVIDGEKRGATLTLSMRDWGPGVPEGMEELIFQEGVRGPAASVTGQGLGLWVVRQLIKAHGGSITVTSRCMPTEFTIFLPATLARF